ncbi:ATP-binding protein [Puteibacter caeruleilacunae]|nr:ATP-binding protein [Puteibacter caeruleilacunae]
MIVEFSVQNFRSIRDLQTLSLIAASIKSRKNKLDTENVIEVSERLSLLKSAAIYGANGSGKSNLIKALITMLVFIDRSFQDDSIGNRIIEPFAFDLDSSNTSSFFQLVFICNNVKYRYGFEIFKNQVKSEWLFGTPKKKEVYYFTREGSTIQINEGKFSEGKDLSDKTSATNLFLNICKAFNGSISKSIVDFFRMNIGISAGINDAGFRETTIDLMKNEQIKQKIIWLLNEADFGIKKIENKQISANDLPHNTPSELRRKVSEEEPEFLLSSRPVFDEQGKEIGTRQLLMDSQESDGTLKFFNYSGTIIETLQNGGALFIDEFDARLHPALTRKLVKLFNSSSTNKNNAQLVFVTHDTNLLDRDLLRRDQIYFTEKNKKSETILYSLADFKGVRNDSSFEKDYIMGKYGAVPFCGNFENIFE